MAIERRGDITRMDVQLKLIDVLDRRALGVIGQRERDGGISSQRPGWQMLTDLALNLTPVDGGTRAMLDDVRSGREYSAVSCLGTDEPERDPVTALETRQRE